MASSRDTTYSLDELRRIEDEASRARSLEQLRPVFERLQHLRRLTIDDFDLQLKIADVQDLIVERGRNLREGAVLAPTASSTTGATNAADAPPDEMPEPPPGVERLDAKSWQRAIYIGLFFTVIILAALFYLINTARRLNLLAPESTTAQTAPSAPATATEKASVKKADNEAPPPTSTKPTVRLYTDLVPGTVSVDDRPPEDLKDGELQLDSLPPGRHSIRVVGSTGDSAFSFDLSEQGAPKVVGRPAANNVMAVLVSSEAGRANLITNADDSEVFVDGTSLGKVSNAGLDVPNLAAVDHDLRVIQNSDRQRFVWTYTPAPALTVYIKSDPNAGTVVIVAGQNDAEVYINDLLYKRRTDRGQIRVPNLKVGTYTVRVHKPGFVDPAPQTLIVRKAEETRAEFHLQAVPAIATLQIKGALPGTMVYVDQTLAAMISADGTASISNVKPGDHAIELSRDQAQTRKFQRTFHTGDVITLAGADVVLEKAVADSKPAIANAPPPAVPENTAPATASNENMQIDGEHVQRGGGFVPYHTTKVAGTYSFAAATRKGGFLKRAKIQWYAAYTDPENYVLYTLDGKHATVREVINGKSVDVGRVPFSSEQNDWVQVAFSVHPNSISARVRSADGGWSDLSPVSSPGRDFTKGKVGLYIPGGGRNSCLEFSFFRSLSNSGANSTLDERNFFRESKSAKPALLNCPYCRTAETYDLQWLVRRKVDKLPRQADERDRAKFAKALSYMVLLDDKAVCKNPRCRRQFEISGIKTTAFLTD